jgi:capsular polysaccharide biosynthesis protein
VTDGSARWFDFAEDAVVTAGHATAVVLSAEVPVLKLAGAERYARPPAGYINEIANPQMDALNADYEAQGGLTVPVARALVLEDAVVLDSGTVMTADCRLVMDSFSIGNRKVVNRVFRIDEHSSDVPFDRPIPFFEGTHLLAKKIGSSNYSHWLVEMLPRIPLVRDAMGAAFDGVRIILPDPGGALGEIVAQSLDMLGLAGRGMVTGHDFVGRFERLIVPCNLSRHPFWLHPAVVRAVEALQAPQPAGRWLFVDRRDSAKRVLRNEDAVFARLQARFPKLERVTCAGLTLAQQAALFGSAEVVVAVMGGSFGNVAFMPRGGRVVCIGPGQYADLFFRNLATQKDMGYLEVRGTPESAAPQASFRLADGSVDAVIGYLEAQT